MRFLSIFAAIVALTPAVMAQGQNPKNCLEECHPYSAGSNQYCDAEHQVCCSYS